MRNLEAKRIETELKAIEAKVTRMRQRLMDDSMCLASGVNENRDKIQWDAQSIGLQTEKICDIIQGL